MLFISTSCELPPDADRFITNSIGFSINFVGNASFMNISERSETGKLINLSLLNFIMMRWFMSNVIENGLHAVAAKKPSIWTRADALKVNENDPTTTQPLVSGDSR